MSEKSFSRTREARSKGREAFPEEAFSSSNPQAFLAKVFRELVRAAPPSGIIQWRGEGIGLMPTRQDQPNERGIRWRPARCASRAEEAEFPPKSARWKLLPLAFPLAKAAGFVSDPSLRAQVDF